VLSAPACHPGPVAGLPGVGAGAFASVMPTSFALRREEELTKDKHELSNNEIAVVPSTNIATHRSRDAHLRAHSHLSWPSTWTA
jgi:hypothetical protein